MYTIMNDRWNCKTLHWQLIKCVNHERRLKRYIPSTKICVVLRNLLCSQITKHRKSLVVSLKIYDWCWKTLIHESEHNERLRHNTLILRLGLYLEGGIMLWPLVENNEEFIFGLSVMHQRELSISKMKSEILKTYSDEEGMQFHLNSCDFISISQHCLV